MRNKHSKTKTLKCKLDKCKRIFYAYSDLQFEYGKALNGRESIKEIIPNIDLTGFEEGDYTSDFYCIKDNGEIMIRECVYTSKLFKPRTMQLLDLSRKYWLSRGITDWGIVIDEKGSSEVRKRDL